MNSIQSKFVSFLVIIQLVSFNALFGMQNQQPQPARPGLGSRIGAALGGGVGAAIDHGAARLWNWVTDADYTVGTVGCRALALGCITSAFACLWKTVRALNYMRVMRMSNRWAIEGPTVITYEDAQMDSAKYGAGTFASIVAFLYLTNNPQRA